VEIVSRSRYDKLSASLSWHLKSATVIKYFLKTAISFAYYEKMSTFANY